MVDKTDTHGAAGAHVGHDKLGTNRLGLWLFIISESFLFGVLLSSRFYLRGVEWPEDLNQGLGLVISIVLLFSSLSA
ncbi:MAG: hypothetical protein FJ312_06430 [SAR202 cluster bacterium]|nr:hypothetical protein [SAR202 cluster bacterium]